MRTGQRLGRAWLLRVWWRFVVALACIAALTLLAMRLAPDAAQFIAGAASAGALTLFMYLYAMVAPGRTYREGAEYERMTARALRPLKRRGWRMAHNVPYEDRDVDHVLVGPGGVIAVETKYRSAHLRVSEAGIVEVKRTGKTFPVTWLLRSALRAAHDLHYIALAVPGGVNVSVTPLLVLWGQAVEGIDSGLLEVDGVLIANGRQWKEWLRRLEGVPISDDEARRAWESIKARKRDH